MIAAASASGSRGGTSRPVSGTTDSRRPAHGGDHLRHPARHAPPAGRSGTPPSPTRARRRRARCRYCAGRRHERAVHTRRRGRAARPAACSSASQRPVAGDHELAPPAPPRAPRGIASSSTSIRFARRSVVTAPTTSPPSARSGATAIVRRTAGSRCGRPPAAPAALARAPSSALELAHADRSRRCNGASARSIDHAEPPPRLRHLPHEREPVRRVHARLPPRASRGDPPDHARLGRVRVHEVERRRARAPAARATARPRADARSRAGTAAPASAAERVLELGRRRTASARARARQPAHQVRRRARPRPRRVARRRSLCGPRREF